MHEWKTLSSSQACSTLFSGTNQSVLNSKFIDGQRIHPIHKSDSFTFKPESDIHMVTLYRQTRSENTQQRETSPRIRHKCQSTYCHSRIHARSLKDTETNPSLPFRRTRIRRPRAHRTEAHAKYGRMMQQNTAQSRGAYIVKPLLEEKHGESIVHRKAT